MQGLRLTVLATAGQEGAPPTDRLRQLMLKVGPNGRIMHGWRDEMANHTYRQSSQTTGDVRNGGKSLCCCPDFRHVSNACVCMPVGECGALLQRIGCHTLLHERDLSNCILLASEGCQGASRVGPEPPAQRLMGAWHGNAWACCSAGQPTAVCRCLYCPRPAAALGEGIIIPTADRNSVLRARWCRCHAILYCVPLSKWLAEAWPESSHAKIGQWSELCLLDTDLT